MTPPEHATFSELYSLRVLFHHLIQHFMIVFWYLCGALERFFV